MPGITNPAEEYFKDGLWGWAATLWEKLVSSGGRLFTALHGWDGSAWQKLSLLWGYSEPWRQTVTVEAVGGGDASASSTAVAANYVYVLQGVSVYHNAGVAKKTECWLTNGTTDMQLLLGEDTASGLRRLWFGELALADGDIITAYGHTLGAGKWIKLHVWGYKMKIAE